MNLRSHQRAGLLPARTFYRISTLITLLFLALILFSCKKENDPPADPTYFLRLSVPQATIGGAGTEVAINLEANSAWTLTMPAGTTWLEIDKTSGTGNETIRIKASAANNTGSKRTVTLTAALANGKAPARTLVIEQEPVNQPAVSIQWKKMLGGSGNDYPMTVLKTADGGHLVAGRTSSNNNGDVPTNHGGIDMLVIKLNATGGIEWKKTFGGQADDVAASLAATGDGGYVITGYTLSSNNGDVGANHGGQDFWVLKINSAGSLQWQKTIGGSHDDWPHAVAVTSEGRIAVAGFTKSNNTGDVGANKGGEDYFVALLDNGAGNLIWKKTIGGSGSDIARAVVATADGGVIVGGHAGAGNGDVPATKGSTDFFLVRLDKDGNIGWKKTLGGNNIEELHGLAIGQDNTLVAVGSTRSNNGDVTGLKGSDDYWVVQLNAGTGAMNWQKTFGGTGAEVARSVALSPAGSVVVAGGTYSHNSGEVGANAGAGDFWIISLSSTGNLQWNKMLGGNDEELAFAIAPAETGSWVVTGYTLTHNNGEVAASHGNADMWVVKVKEM